MTLFRNRPKGARSCRSVWPGTNLLAWLMTILRNTYFNEKRRDRRLSIFDENMVASIAHPTNERESLVHFRDVARRFECLPALQREALMLVGANGFSYELAAQIAGCAIGTMKSRVSRARGRLSNSCSAMPNLPPPNSGRPPCDSGSHSRCQRIIAGL